MKSTLSLLGMYQYRPDILDEFVLPNGIEKNIVVNNLLVETAELEILYSDPDIIKSVIGFWSKKELPIWEKLYATTQFEYNPIWNTDREYITTDTTTRTTNENVKENNKNGEENKSETNTTTGTSYDSDTTGSTSQDNVETTEVAAFNEGLSDSQRVTQDNDGETTETTNAESSGHSNSTLSTTINRNEDNNRDRTEDETITYKHHEEGHGNIGVTTTQKMINEEREVVKFNIVDYIIDSFKERFCLLIY